jgi:hypothetical protein
MAGAMTIPIKARAIKKSCMIEVPFGTQYAADLPLDHRRDEKNLEIPRKVGCRRGSGRWHDGLESNERHMRAQCFTEFTKTGDEEHNGV